MALGDLSDRAAVVAAIEEFGLMGREPCDDAYRALGDLPVS